MMDKLLELFRAQTFVSSDFAVIGLLVILEGVLSIDNALVLGLLAKRLPKSQQGRALTYGLIGAFFFRFVAIATAQYLLRWTIVKLLGGFYLLYVAGKFFFFESKHEDGDHIEEGPSGQPVMVDDETGESASPDQEGDDLSARNPVPSLEAANRTKLRKFAAFWPTVVVIELTDIAFAIDSILAAIALVGAPPAGHVGFHPKLWVVVSGGMLGVILMRFAAVVFIRLLERFPRFEISAYLLVAVIGGKLTADWMFNGGPLELARMIPGNWRESLGIHRLIEYFGQTIDSHPHLIDFHSPATIAFWVFWVLMLASLAVGFIPKRSQAS